MDSTSLLKGKELFIFIILSHDSAYANRPTSPKIVAEPYPPVVQFPETLSSQKGLRPQPDIQLCGKSLQYQPEIYLKQRTCFGKDASHQIQSRKRLVDEILESINATAKKSNQSEQTSPPIDLSFMNPPHPSAIRVTTNSPVEELPDERPAVPKLISIQHTINVKPAKKSIALQKRDRAASPVALSSESSTSSPSRNHDIMNTLMSQTTNEAREVDYIMVKTNKNVYEESLESRFQKVNQKDN